MTPESFLNIAAAGWTAASALSLRIASRNSGTRGLPGCAAGSGCDAVTASHWSRVGPVSVSVLGAMVYLVGGASSLIAANVTTSDSAAGLVAGIAALVSVGAMSWFMTVQLLIIRKVCLYCSVIHVLAAGSAVAVLVGRPSTVSAPTVAVAATGLAVLIGWQVLRPARRYAFTPAALVQGFESTALAPTVGRPESSPRTENDYRPSRRLIRLYGNAIELKWSDWPSIGSPDAPNVCAVLMDFTCAECHRLHWLMRQAVGHYGGRLAVVIVPVPLNENCNPSVKCHQAPQVSACRYARVAWHLFLDRPDRYADWDDYLTGEPEAQPYGLALGRARQLSSEWDPDFEQRPDVARQLAAGLEVAAKLEPVKVPAVVLQTGVLRGRVPDLQHLLNLLDGHVAAKTTGGPPAAEKTSEVAPA